MIPLQSLLLFADITKVIGILVFLSFLVLWVIGQIAEANKKAAARVNRPAGPPAPGPGAGKAPAGQQADPLRQQMEEFLRRAQQGNKPPVAENRPQPVADRIEILLDDSQAVREQRPVPQQRPLPLSAAKQQPAAKQRTKPRRLAPKGEGVAQHVAQHVDASRQALAQSAAQLGQRIVEDDKQFDVQLKAKFDHELGALGTDRSLASQPQPMAVQDSTSPVALIAAMLANPDGARQAIILNEVLRRPTDRW